MFFDVFFVYTVLHTKSYEFDLHGCPENVFSQVSTVQIEA